LQGLRYPTSILVDSAAQKVYVSDQVNHRVLRYTSTSAVLTNGSAEFALFGNTTATCLDGTLDTPDQLDYYGSDLFVADSGNNRVLKLSNVDTTNATITSPATVFGQLNSSTCAAPTGQSDLFFPSGVAINNNGSLYVSEASGSQALCYIKRFDNAHNTTNYPSPSSLLGNGTCATLPGQSAISDVVYHLFVDPDDGHLFAADYNLGRVNLWKNAQNKANASSSIDTVFGKANFTDTTINCDNTLLSGPYGVFYDEARDTLIVGDQSQNRIVFYINAAIVPSGNPSSLILGQVNSTQCVTATSQSGLSGVTGVNYDDSFPGIFLIAADSTNNRIVRYECTNATFSFTVSLNASIAPTSPGSSTGSLPASSIAGSSVAGSSVIGSSSGVVANASSSGVVANASSSGVVVSSSGVAVNVSSSGAVVSSSGVAVNASSSGVAVNASSSGAPPTSSQLPLSSGASVPLSSGVIPSTSDTGSVSQSNTPSVTNPNNTPTQSAIVPPQPPVSGQTYVPSVCGNGVLEAGEQCDAGAANPRTKCCTSVCTNLRNRAVCGKATSKCTKRPKCGRNPAVVGLVCNPGAAKRVGAPCGKGGLFSRKTCKADGSCTK